MKLTSGLRSSLAWIALLTSAVLLGAASTKVQIQIIAFLIALVLAFALYSIRRVMVMAAILVPTIALLRRLLSGPSGYTPSDPLVLLPFSLVLICFAISIGSSRQYAARGRWSVALSIAVALGVAITVVLRVAFDVQSLYSALSLAVPMLLIAGTVSGRIPDMWPAIKRVIPWLGLAVGIYGVIQFLFLPPWDKNWMITSDLQSIGSPLPLQVRVFGTAESPGPYATFVGLAVVVALCNAVLTKLPLKQFGWFALSATLSIPLLLSGVRTGLIAVLVCAAILVIVRGRGVGRVLPLALVAVVGFALARVLSALAGSSSILTADRYTNFNANTDNSFQSRLDILSDLKNPFAYVIGSPSPGRVDNLSIDVLESYGLLAGVGVSVLLVMVFVTALRNLLRKSGEVAALCAIFMVVGSFSGNLFSGPFGLLVGFVFAAVFVSRGKSVSLPLATDERNLAVTAKILARARP